MKGYISLDSVLFSGVNCYEIRQYIRAWGICCQLLGSQDANKDISVSLDKRYSETGCVPCSEKVVDISNPNTAICLDTPFIASYSSLFGGELFVSMLREEVDVLPSFCFYESEQEYHDAVERCYRELEKELFLPTNVLSIVSPCGSSASPESNKVMACIIGCVLSEDRSGDQ